MYKTTYAVFEDGGTKNTLQCESDCNFDDKEMFCELW
jgi:hypothetical protein